MNSYSFLYIPIEITEPVSPWFPKDSHRAHRAGFLARRALIFILPTAGNKIAAKIPMMAMVTSSSVKVNAREIGFWVTFMAVKH